MKGLARSSLIFRMEEDRSAGEMLLDNKGTVCRMANEQLSG